jgi:hypothetical protein
MDLDPGGEESRGLTFLCPSGRQSVEVEGGGDADRRCHRRGRGGRLTGLAAVAGHPLVALGEID